jgi:hypothetical protein
MEFNFQLILFLHQHVFRYSIDNIKKTLHFNRSTYTEFSTDKMEDY